MNIPQIRKKRGFTLIEIMVVVVIIGLLIALAGPRIWALLGFGQASVAEAKCKEYYDQAKLYKTIRKQAPGSLDDLTEPLRPGTDSPFPRIEEDPWGNRYVLEGAGKDMRVRSFGPDGLEATEDDIVWPPEEKD